jgi:hypothetical protein
MLKNSLGLAQGTLKNNMNMSSDSHQIHSLPAEQQAGESNQHMPGPSREPETKEWSSQWKSQSFPPPPPPPKKKKIH